MTALLQNLASDIGQDKMAFFAPYVWVYQGQNPAIMIKIEETRCAHKLFVNASFARDGSGFLMASFMSMLLIEDSHATSADTNGVCSGHASITLYHMLDISALDSKRLLSYLENFEALALCVLEQAAGLSQHGTPSNMLLSRSQVL